MARKTIRGVPLNRVEGDLEIRVELTDGKVTDSWSSGTMFRGFERLMVGRGAMDGLVITPRVCGLCSLCHLMAAARSLDMIAGAKVPDDAVRIRNVVTMTEHIQSDMRHGFLMFATDFTNPSYKKHSLYDEAVRRYEAFKGRTVLDVIRETKKLLEIVAIIGGQWPHTSFMVPGGVSCLPSAGDILQCRQLLAQYKKWYESSILGCTIDRWMENKTAKDIDKWLDESDSHQSSDLGIYIRFSKEAGLDKFGKGHEKFLSYGALDMPEQTAAVSMGKGTKFIPSGFAEGVRGGWFDQQKITEQVYYSWYEDYDGGKHPMEGETNPYASGDEGKKYSWTKAPRYDGEPAETGPLAEMIISENPLFVNMLKESGASVYLRELARLTRPAFLINAMDIWLREIKVNGNRYYKPADKIVSGEGFGLTQAARGALGHWVKIENEQITHYQIITPTAWNASPRDSDGVRGPWEEALIGTEVRDIDNPVELGHVIRSYDSCMVCCVHTVSKGREKKLILP